MTTFLLIGPAAQQLTDDLNPKSDWTVLTAEDGQSALSLVQEQAVDIVICDAQLPDTGAIAFHSQLMEVEPRAIRFTTATDDAIATALDSAQVNHRLLSLPSPPGAIFDAIACSLELRRILVAPAVIDFVGSIRSVPALPSIYNEMMQELSSPHGSMMGVGQIIERDTGLTVTLMKMVNSAFYGMSQHIESVPQAVSLLGIHMIKNMALTAKVFTLFDGGSLGLNRLAELNSEAQKLGALSSQFGRFAKVHKNLLDHAQIAGMLANIGDLLISLKPDGLNMVNQSESPIKSEIMGAYLLRMWSLPDPVVEAVALQHESPLRYTGAITPLTILHSIRYMQTNFSDTRNKEDRQATWEYLCTYLPENTADDWIDAFTAVHQLTSDNKNQAA